MSTNSSDENHYGTLKYIPSRRSKLQGPRPAALKVSKCSSSKIKKPSDHHHHQDHQSRPRSPVVIYLVSPKIIHVRPEEFMGLVQRLTGKQASSSSSSTTSYSEIGKNSKSVNDSNEISNYADDQLISSSLSTPSDLTPYSRLCIDIYSEWDEF